MTLGNLATYINLRLGTTTTTLTAANMAILLNTAHDRVAAFIRTWYDNYRPTAWTGAEVTTGTIVPPFDADFHELLGLWVCYQYALDNGFPNAAGILNEIQLKEEKLKYFYGGRRLKVFTVSIASPGVFTLLNHSLIKDDIVSFVTSGALPTGLSVDTLYYVISDGLEDDNFQVSSTRGGSAINTSGTQSGTHWFWTKKQGRLVPGYVQRGDSSK